VDKNHYSVPIRYAGLKVKTIGSVDHVDIYYGSKKIASHKRIYGNNKWQLEPFHYLELILMRPQAFESARPIKEWREDWPECLEMLLRHFREKQGQSKGTKEFIRVLMLFKDHDEREVISAVEEAVSANVSCSEAVEQILVFRTVPKGKAFVSLPNWGTLPPPDISVYDRIGGGL